MHISTAIRQGYYQKLKDLDIPVYASYAPPEGGSAYIILSTQTASERENKACKSWLCSIVVDIVTTSIVPTGLGLAESYAEQVEELIHQYANSNPILPSGYEIGNTNKESDTDIVTRNEANYVYRKILKYNHLISK